MGIKEMERFRLFNHITMTQKHSIRSKHFFLIQKTSLNEIRCKHQAKCEIAIASLVKLSLQSLNQHSWFQITYEEIVIP